MTAAPLDVLTVDKLPHALGRQLPHVVPVQLEPLRVQFTALPSLVVAVRDSVCVTVNAARFGVIETGSGCGAIVKVRLTDLLCTGMLESFTVKVSAVAVAEAVGVPLITPDEEFSTSPAGRLPLVSDQLYGVVPPVAESVALYAVPTCPLGSKVVTTPRALALVFALAVDEQTARNAKHVKTTASGVFGK